MKVAIVNYGMGNLGSVRRALADLGAQGYVAEEPEALKGADRIVLPGVGAFSEGMARLGDGRWIDVLCKLVRTDSVPVLGICLGMQMLAASGDEGGGAAGLGLLEGKVRRLDSLGCDLRLPHVGWNDITFADDDPLFAHVPQQSDFYFVHSYAMDPAGSPHTVAVTSYGVTIVAAVRERHIAGVQFHPEKSSRAGRQVLQNFLELQSC